MWEGVDSVEVIPIVIGSMGTVKKNLKKYLERLPVEITTLKVTTQIVKKSNRILRLVLGCG